MIFLEIYLCRLSTSSSARKQKHVAPGVAGHTDGKMVVIELHAGSAMLSNVLRKCRGIHF